MNLMPTRMGLWTSKSGWLPCPHQHTFCNNLNRYKTYFLKSDDPSSVCRGFRSVPLFVHSDCARQPSNITEADLTDSFKILDTHGAGKVNLTQFKTFYIQVFLTPHVHLIFLDFC
jgi:hypothetical protein